MKQVVPAKTLKKKKKTHVVLHGDTFEEIESIHAMVAQPGGFYIFAKHIQVSTTLYGTVVGNCGQTVIGKGALKCWG